MQSATVCLDCNEFNNTGCIRSDIYFTDKLYIPKVCKVVICQTQKLPFFKVGVSNRKPKLRIKTAHDLC